MTLINHDHIARLFLPSGWKLTHLTSVFSLQASIFTSPHGTTLTAFADVKYGCLQMLDGMVSTHPFLPCYFFSGNTDQESSFNGN